MRPLTLRRLLLQCSMLAVILFVVVVIALKFGAVPVSLYALGRDLLRVVFGQSNQISSDYGLIVVNIRDRKSTRLNSSHRCISYAVFCLKKKNTMKQTIPA